jgi:hypothetical protein
MKQKLQQLLLLCLSIFGTLHAQIISDFENINLPAPPPGGYWNGSDFSGGFNSGGMYFKNSYDSSFGGYWAGGFACSSISDSITAGFTNLYAARPASGYNASQNYAVAQQNSIAYQNNQLIDVLLHGFYVTNGTYAFYSMLNGDAFAKKFGDTTGTNSGLPQGSFPDYFKLTVRAYLNGFLKNDSVEFYLADYRFSNDSLDYIVDTWQWVDCTNIGVFDSLVFNLSSSDNGLFGMNTPAFFCIDNLEVIPTVGMPFIANNHNQIVCYPNPASTMLNFANDDHHPITRVSIYNAASQLVFEQNSSNLKNISIDHLPSGIYLLEVTNTRESIRQKLIKQ